MEQGVMGGWVHTSDFHLFLSSGQWNESFQEVKLSASHAMNTLNRSVLSGLQCLLC